MNKNILYMTIILLVLTIIPYILPMILSLGKKEHFRYGNCYNDSLYWGRTEWPSSFMLGLFPYRYSYAYDYYYDPYYYGY